MFRQDTHEGTAPVPSANFYKSNIFKKLSEQTNANKPVDISDITCNMSRPDSSTQLHGLGRLNTLNCLATDQTLLDASATLS